LRALDSGYWWRFDDDEQYCYRHGCLSQGASRAWSGYQPDRWCGRFPAWPDSRRIVDRGIVALGLPVQCAPWTLWSILGNLAATGDNPGSRTPAYRLVRRSHTCHRVDRYFAGP